MAGAQGNSPCSGDTASRVGGLGEHAVLGPFTAVGQQLIPRHGAPEQIALQGVAAQLGQQGALGLGLHPFGYDACPGPDPGRRWRR